MTNMIIDENACTKCGNCAAICPAKCITYSRGEVPRQNSVRAGICMECGQCMAVCTPKAIVTGHLDYERDFFDPGEARSDFDAFWGLVATRRSVRNFKNQPVPREALEKVVAAIAQAPMGFPPHKTAVTVVQDRKTVAGLFPDLLAFYQKMLDRMKNPVMRLFIRMDAGPEKYASVVNHLMPILKVKVPDMLKGGDDEIARGAPALILLHSDKLAENHTKDACIALGFGLLAAHALGLGATAIDLIPEAVNRSPELRNKLQLPENHEVVASMIIGYPRYKYQRAIRRDLASVNWI